MNTSTNEPLAPVPRKMPTFRSRMFLVFGCLSAVLMITLSLIRSFGIPAWGIQGEYQEMLDHSVDTLGLVADMKKEYIRNWFRERQGDLAVLDAGLQARWRIAGYPAVQTKAEILSATELRELETIFVKTTKHYSSVEAFYLVDVDSGRIVISSDRTAVGTIPGDTEQFKAFMASGRNTDIWFSTLDGDDSGYMKVVRKVKVDGNGERPAAVLASRLNMDEFLLPMLYTGGGLGRSGEVVLVDHERRILAPLMHSMSNGIKARIGTYQLESEPVVLAASGREGVLFSTDYAGHPVVACYRHLMNVDAGQGWGLVVKQDRSELMAPLWRRLVVSSFIGLAAFFAFMMGIAWLAHHFAKPLRMMESAAAGISAGDFSVRFRPFSYREVYGLSTAFNLMAERLQDWDATLRLEIAEKTKQLSEELSERINAQEALRASGQILEGVINTMPVRVFWKDRNLVYLGCNEAFAHDAGFANPQDLIGKDDSRTGWRGQAELYRGDDCQIIESGQPRLFVEESLTLPDGRAVTILTSKLPLRNSKGEISGILGVYMDITARKQAEREKERLMTAINQTSEAVMITDAEGTIQYVNPAFESVTGYRAEEAVGQNPRFLKSGLQDTAFYNGLWETLVTGGTWCGRLVNRRKDGTLYTEEATISPVKDTTGTIVNFVAVKRDVTEDLKLEEKFRQSQKMQSIGQLAGGVAHDFNNLLQIISGYAEIARGQVAENISPVASIDEIAKAGEHAKNLVRQLLAFSRQQLIDPADLDLNAEIAGSKKMLERLLGENIRLQFTAGKGLSPVFADKGQISQILINLCLNARDAMLDGGTLTIKTEEILIDPDDLAARSLTRSDRCVLLSIADTGCGMDKTVCEKIFDPFFTTKEVGKGTGLGLSTVYGIVKQSEGYISVDSEPGKGTVFKIYLPVSRPLPAGLINSISADSESDDSGGVETILVVEDEATLLKLATQLLTGKGYAVLTAKDGEEAVRVFEEHADEIDIVMMDVVMPRMGGKEAMARILEKRPSLRYLFVSGYSSDRGHSDFIKDKDLHLLCKPYQAADLFHKIREVLNA